MPKEIKTKSIEGDKNRGPRVRKVSTNKKKGIERKREEEKRRREREKHKRKRKRFLKKKKKEEKEKR